MHNTPDKPTKPKQAEEQPWAKQFDDDQDDAGNLSRVASRRKKHGNRLLWVILWVLLALVVIVPVTYQVLKTNSVNSGGNYAGEKIVVDSSKKSSSSSKQASSSSSTVSKSSSSKASSSQASSSSVAKSSSSSVASSSSSNASSSTSGMTTYTVKAGENPYRIALNHGMTLAEFYAANPGVEANGLTPNQQVKVKAQ
ncbi:LysM peptidoglycan-binding domain-containing protein [Lacticaseibacillus yichunensis]|uniref:LysM peptidoglycan-binding domain-containing protein n=1 Tax=Lacticaseibacillus yichunensis TaxID=2486015 RepID=A0ABW4CU07_9LACO|nr:LysM domain-containing protein [Lacticaseibacillus yichunensis]